MAQRTVIVGAGMATALLLSTLVAEPGWARGHGIAREVLVRPSEGTDPDAVGTLRTKHRADRTQVVLHVRHLDARTVYAVQDGATDESLGTLRTNRRGKGHLRLDLPAAAKTASTGATHGALRVVRQDTGEPVLQVDGDETAGPPDETGPRATTGDVGLSDSAASDPDVGYMSIQVATVPGLGVDYLSAVFTEWVGEGALNGTLHVLRLDALAGDALPLGAEHAADLAGRDFEIRDVDDTTLLAGTLPDATTTGPIWDFVAYSPPVDRGAPAPDDPGPDAGGGDNAGGTPGTRAAKVGAAEAGTFRLFFAADDGTFVPAGAFVPATGVGFVSAWWGNVLPGVPQDPRGGGGTTDGGGNAPGTPGTR